MKGAGPVLVVKGLTVERDGAEVLRKVDATVRKGDFVGIIGPNGGGKTTFVLAVLGLIQSKRGKVELFGTPLRHFKDWGRIAYVSQNATDFDPHFPLTVRELVSLGRVRRGNLGRPLKKEDWNAVDEALSAMGITGIASRRIGDLSGGQKQRVFVAKALVRHPDLIFLDEPVAGVDSSAQELFYKKLSDLNASTGITILLVSHDLTAVFCRMSKVMCVNKEVHMADVTPDLEPNDLLRKAYGEHFQFVFHRHTCRGDFGNG